MCLVTSLLLLTAPAFAQEPLEQTGTEPSAQTSPAPSDTAPANEPLDKTGTEPSSQQAAPAADAAPANEPLDQVGAEPSHPGDQQAGVPAMIVVTDLSKVEDDNKLVQPWGVPVDSVEEMDVYDANGKKIGEVDAVLEDKNGEVKGVVIGYGGFLGFGEKGAIVTIDQVKLKDGTLVTDVNEEQLSQQPEWMK
jgi:sporulation protein YlmC with PRC-barrel domain